MNIAVFSAAKDGPELPTNARLLEEIEAAGHEAQLVNYRESSVVFNGAATGLYEYDEETGQHRRIEADVIIPRIGAYVKSASYAIDFMAHHLGAATTLTSAALRAAKDKVATHLRLNAEGVPTPPTAAPVGKHMRGAEFLLGLIEEDPSKPVIVKANRGAWGKGVSIADSRRSSASFIGVLGSNSSGFHAQRFVEPLNGQLPNDIRAIVSQNTIVAAMRRISSKEGEFRANLHLGGNAVPHNLTERERTVALRAAEVLDLHFAGVDLLESPEGPQVTEVNANPGLEIETITGKNVAGALVALAIYQAEARHA